MYLGQIVEIGSRDQVFQHVLVVGKQTRVDRHAAHVVLARHRHFDEARARLPFDFDLSKLLLHLLHVFLHLLGLFHQPGQLTFHHGNAPS